MVVRRRVQSQHTLLLGRLYDSLGRGYANQLLSKREGYALAPERIDTVVLELEKRSLASIGPIVLDGGVWLKNRRSARRSHLTHLLSSQLPLITAY